MAMTIDERLATARARLDRVPVAALAHEIEAGALLVDIRPAEQRIRDGEVPGALVLETNVILWRLAPSSDARIVDVVPDRRVIVMCDEGFVSSLVAADLLDVGVARATDLVGGYQAWRACYGPLP